VGRREPANQRWQDRSIQETGSEERRFPRGAAAQICGPRERPIGGGRRDLAEADRLLLGGEREGDASRRWTTWDEATPSSARGKSSAACSALLSSHRPSRSPAKQVHRTRTTRGSEADSVRRDAGGRWIGDGWARDPGCRTRGDDLTLVRAWAASLATA